MGCHPLSRRARDITRRDFFLIRGVGYEKT
jgi:hypothetical protein